jgi:hypothetical protein
LTAEWRHVAARFHAFVSELEPTPHERYATWKAATDVGALLGRRFHRPAFDPNPAAGELIAIGSHGKGTALRGSRKADAMFVVPDRFQSGMFLGCDASKPAGEAEDALPPLVRDMIALLHNRYGAVKISPDSALTVLTDVAVDGEKISIRILPCFAHDSGYFVATRAHARHQDYWSNFDPLAEARNLDRIDTVSAGKARHLIRMLKAWRRTSGAPIASLALERLTCEFLRVWIYQRRSTLFYDWMVRDFFFWLTAQTGRTLYVPGSHEGLALGDTWLASAEAAHAAASNASDLERDNRNEQALVRWREIFGLVFGGNRLPPPPPAASCRLIPWQALPLTG